MMDMNHSFITASSKSWIAEVYKPHPGICPPPPHLPFPLLPREPYDDRLQHQESTGTSRVGKWCST